MTSSPRPEEIAPPERVYAITGYEWPSPRERSRTLANSLAFVGAMVLTLLFVDLAGGSVLSALGVGLVVGSVIHLSILVLKLRRRVAARTARDGDPAWETDWAGARDVAASCLLATSVPRWCHAVLAPVGVFLAMWAKAGVQRNDWTSGLACGGLAIVGIALLIGWVVFRGGVQVKFDRFPYVVGEPATFWIATTSGSPRLAHAEVLLRCVACPDCADCRRSGHLSTLWSRHWVAARDAGPGPDEFIPATFDLPPDALGSALRAKRPVRWELLVAGRTRWGKVMERFVVPVYGRGAPS